MQELWLSLIAFLTSTFTAIFGVGGGVLLIVLMPGLLPPAAIIPVHAVVQLASNGSRVLFAWRTVEWSIVGRYAGGACLGAVIGSETVMVLNPEWIPLLLGLFILLLTWLPPLPMHRLPYRFFSFGAIHTLLATLTGATGPLSSAFLSREGLQRDSLVTTTGAFMGTAHALKILAFILLGFSFSPYLSLMLWMSLAAIVGSWVGTRLRRFLPEISFQRFFKVLLSLLALRLIGMTLY